MNTQDFADARKKLETLIRAGAFKNKKIFFFGRTDDAAVSSAFLAQKGLPVFGILNNSKRLAGQTCGGLKVYKPEEIFAGGAKGCAAITVSRYHKAMLAQLEKLGFDKNCFFRLDKFYYFATAGGNDDSLWFFLKNCFHMLRAKLLVRWLTAKYGLGKEGKVYVCGYPGLGDVYLACAHLGRHAKSSGTEKYALVVPHEAGRDIALAFDIKNVAVLGKQARLYLVALARFLQEPGIETICLSYDYANNFAVGLGFKQLNMRDIYEQAIFTFPRRGPKAAFRPKSDPEYIERLMAERGVAKGKSAIFFPYAGSVDNIPHLFWLSLIACLKEKGYGLFSNTTNEEVALPGTKPLSFPVREAKAVVEYAGWAVMNRSGICDVLSQAKCRKTVFYMPQRWMDNRGHIFDAFSLRAMGMGEGAEEIVLDGQALRGDITAVRRQLGL
ncbi:MAG: hypothetical protein LBO03_07790 [Acidaminococcales bacterium]|nr:hypothetical protein [Acidaminococcales bacterium]